VYFLAPNVKQRFAATLPGAILAVGCWIALSCQLGLYFRQFANFNKTYGTLGAAIALIIWLYWTGFAMLVGAELQQGIDESGRVCGLFRSTGIRPQFAQRLATVGDQLPPSLFESRMEVSLVVSSSRAVG